MFVGMNKLEDLTPSSAIKAKRTGDRALRESSARSRSFSAASCRTCSVARISRFQQNRQTVFHESFGATKNSLPQSAQTQTQTPAATCLRGMAQLAVDRVSSWFLMVAALTASLPRSAWSACAVGRPILVVVIRAPRPPAAPCARRAIGR